MSSIQLTSNLWELKLDTVLNAEINQHLIGNFVNSFVVVKISSQNALPAWKQAGSLGQAITFENTLAYGQITNIVLDTYSLIYFPSLTDFSYQLYYFPLNRLKTVTFQIWEYLGETKDSQLNTLIKTLESEAILQVDLTSLKKQLTNLEKGITAIAGNKEHNDTKTYLSSFSPNCSDSNNFCLDKEKQELTFLLFGFI